MDYCSYFAYFTQYKLLSAMSYWYLSSLVGYLQKLTAVGTGLAGTHRSWQQWGWDWLAAAEATGGVSSGDGPVGGGRGGLCPPLLPTSHLCCQQYFNVSQSGKPAYNFIPTDPAWQSSSAKNYTILLQALCSLLLDTSVGMTGDGIHYYCC